MYGLPSEIYSMCYAFQQPFPSDLLSQPTALVNCALRWKGPTPQSTEHGRGSTSARRGSLSDAKRIEGIHWHTLLAAHGMQYAVCKVFMNL